MFGCYYCINLRNINQNLVKYGAIFCNYFTVYTWLEAFSRYLSSFYRNFDWQPLKIRMGCSVLIVSICMEQSIRIKRVNWILCFIFFQFLHYFAFCHEECPDDFHIVTNFPRRTLPCEPTDDNEEPISFSECGLGKNEMVFVQDNEA